MVNISLLEGRQRLFGRGLHLRVDAIPPAIATALRLSQMLTLSIICKIVGGIGRRPNSTKLNWAAKWMAAGAALEAEVVEKPTRIVYRRVKNATGATMGLPAGAATQAVRQVPGMATQARAVAMLARGTVVAPC
mmetsp:Transcript_15657/g.47527  ORF Transcript_15657/g.47527 Transcript_15657/m.47527 type:complete len:134 (+) Transcript_15657:460-861(+)